MVMESYKLWDEKVRNLMIEVSKITSDYGLKQAIDITILRVDEGIGLKTDFTPHLNLIIANVNNPHYLGEAKIKYPKEEYELIKQMIDELVVFELAAMHDYDMLDEEMANNKVEKKERERLPNLEGEADKIFKRLEPRERL